MLHLRQSVYKKVLFLSLLFIVLVNFILYTKSSLSTYTRPFYPLRLQVLRDLFDKSQYTVPGSKIAIPDEFYYALAGWNYLHGQNPALFNAEQPPLGKYFIALTIEFFNNETLTGPIFNFLCLVTLFFLGVQVLGSKVWSLAMTTTFSFEHLFMVQMLYAPLLDNIQLFFILLSFLAFIYWVKGKISLILALIFLGCVISVKFWISGVVIYVSWIISILWLRKAKDVLRMALFTPLALIPLFISYIPSFASGDNLHRFFGIQKYIFVYHSGKFDFNPLSYFNLLLFNNWRNSFSVDWQITWIVLLLLSIIGIVWIYKNRRSHRDLGILVMGSWFAVYTIFLFFGELLPRYLIPILPAMYLLSFYLLKEVYGYLD